MEEVALMVAWLSSAENSFTTGGVFDLSGGRSTYWNDPYGENNEQWLPGQGTVDIT